MMRAPRRGVCACVCRRDVARNLPPSSPLSETLDLLVAQRYGFTTPSCLNTRCPTLETKQSAAAQAESTKICDELRSTDTTRIYSAEFAHLPLTMANMGLTMDNMSNEENLRSGDIERVASTLADQDALQFTPPNGENLKSGLPTDVLLNWFKVSLEGLSSTGATISISFQFDWKDQGWGNQKGMLFVDASSAAVDGPVVELHTELAPHSAGHGAAISISFQFDWKDQGWGNQKGMLFVDASSAAVDGPTVELHTELAPHSAAHGAFRKRFLEEIETTLLAEDHVEFFSTLSKTRCFRVRYRVGGGGGHTLTVNNFVGVWNYRCHVQGKTVLSPSLSLADARPGDLVYIRPTDDTIAIDSTSPLGEGKEAGANTGIPFIQALLHLRGGNLRGLLRLRQIQQDVSLDDSSGNGHIDLIAPFPSNVLEAFASYVNEGRLDMQPRTRVSAWLDLWCLARFYGITALAANLWHVLPAMFEDLPKCEVPSCPLTSLSFYEGHVSERKANAPPLDTLPCLTPLGASRPSDEAAKGIPAAAAAAAECNLLSHCELLCALVTYGKKHAQVEFVDFALHMAEREFRGARHHVGVIHAVGSSGRECKCWDCRQLEAHTAKNTAVSSSLS